MKLNLKILKQKLPESYNCRLFGDQQDALNCPRPIMLGNETELQSGRFYVLSTSVLPYITPRTDCFFACIGTNIPFEWQKAGTPILQITEALDFATVFNEVSRIYDHYDQWDEALRDELEKTSNFDIKTILRLGIEELENRIIVTDQSLKVIFSAQIETDSYGRKRINVNTGSYIIGPDMTDSVRKVCNLERHIKVPYLSSIKHGDHASYCQNLYPLGYFTGCISLNEFYRTFIESDFPIANYYFKIFQNAFEKYLHEFTGSEEDNNSVLQKILRNQPLNYEEKQSLRLSECENWICFKLKEKSHSSFMPKDYMHAALCTFIPQVHCSAIYHQSIVGLLKLNKNDNLKDICMSFEEMLNRMNYTAGFSNFFHDINHFDMALIQADYCLQNNQSVLTLFDEQIIHFLINECSTRLSIDALTDQSLRRVIEYDAQKGTCYLKTLEVYLKNELAITPTAEELFIHRSSLLKRLDKLKSLLQDNLESPERRLYYRLWFSIEATKKSVVTNFEKANLCNDRIP